MRVPLKRLSAILDDARIDRFDFVKIDVEGAEELILRDARDLIVRNDAAVLFEFNSWAQMRFAGRSPLVFAECITAAFTHVFLVREQGQIAVLERVDAAAWDKILYTNIVHDPSMTDILATNVPERISPSTLLPQYADIARSLEIVRAEIMVLRSSTSWRITAPLRALRRRL